jgi:hypothetical protein
MVWSLGAIVSVKHRKQHKESVSNLDLTPPSSPPSPQSQRIKTVTKITEALISPNVDASVPQVTAIKHYDTAKLINNDSDL